MAPRATSEISLARVRRMLASTALEYSLRLAHTKPRALAAVFLKPAETVCHLLLPVLRLHRHYQTG